MARRFTDTDKWQDDWFLSLSNDWRIINQYSLDRCSSAGLLKRNFKMLNFCCNTNITEKQYQEVFKNRAFIFGDFYFLPKFLKYQYPKGLNSNKPAIISVRNELFSYPFFDSLILIIRQSLGNDYLIIKDKDKDKDKEICNTDNYKNTHNGWECPLCHEKYPLSKKISHMASHRR